MVGETQRGPETSIHSVSHCFYMAKPTLVYQTSFPSPWIAFLPFEVLNHYPSTSYFSLLFLAEDGTEVGALAILTGYSIAWVSCFPGDSVSTESAYNMGPGFDPWVRKFHWRKEWLLTPVFLPGEFQGQRLQFMGLQRVGPSRVINTFTFPCLYTLLNFCLIFSC